MENGVQAGLQQAAGGGGGGGGWVLVEARLQGGAPWGFTLQGGLEHGEPLIISKVEEGGKADSLEQPLLVGDEIIIINDVELTGYRQDAIALVKGSYKTLRLTIRREFEPGYIEEFGTSPPSLPALPPPPSPPLSSLSLPPPPPPPPPQQQQTQRSSHHSRPCLAGGVQLRIKNRRSEPASRPHSWHSTKLNEGQQQSDQGGMDTMSSAWHHNYHTSASTTDLSGGFDSGGIYMRKSPDQYSSRGSMESLDHPLSSQLHSGAKHPHIHSGPHPAYSSCHQLSSSRSSNSIDHLQSKRDSAYSSFSTSSSIPEYLASTPSFSPERSYSLETVPQRGGEMQQADICYVQQSLSQEHELSSTSVALLRNSNSRRGPRPGLSQDRQDSVGGSSSSGSSSDGVPASNRHSVGPIWGPAASRSSYESLKGAPAPPRRSDSYAAIRNHERPNSWSSLEHARSLRSLQKGSWHHSSGPVASGAAKGSYGAEGLLHTVIEKSPESSPTTKPRQGGGFPQPPSLSGPSSEPAGPISQSGWLILPTGMYPVPQPEPHYAQMPSASHRPGSSGVYPALAKESSGQQQLLQGVIGRKEGASERRRDVRMSATENGYQNNTSSSLYPYSSSTTSAPTQLKTQAHEGDRPQQKEVKSDQTRDQRPLNQGPHVQSFQGSHLHASQRPHSQVFQEQNQDFHIPHVQSTAELRPPSSQEWVDPCIPVQSKGDRNRSMDQTSINSEPVASSGLTQGELPLTHLPVHPQPQDLPPSASQHPPRHLSESAVLQYQQWDHKQQDKDREHPLTRLEIALAEVQRCASPNSVVSASSHGNSSLGNDSQGPVRSLSVLEKVSRFERRECTGKQRSHSTTNVQDKATHLRMSDKGYGTPCGADDLRNMLERSTSRIKAHRTLSYRGGSSEYTKYRTPVDPSSALQRSRSSFQLDESREGDSSKDFPLTQDIQEILGYMQDTSFNRSYRDSIKDAQSKVLQSTSFRRRDLSSSISPPPPAATPLISSSSSNPPPPVPAKHHSLEKKGPKTMPKPQGIVITPQSQPPLTSLHTPKERHVVSPETRGPSPPALPSLPPVGPPALMRICGRKRLTVDQKKQSYSEPENMNEVGISDAETDALFRRGGETSVADRRKMFELVASRVRGGSLHNTTSRPDLRQLQHNALADYVERKRSVKREKGGQRSGLRPHSAYLQPENSNYTVSSCHSDTLSLSSTSSLLSLQDSGTDRSFSFGERRLCSTLPPEADLRSLQSNLFYPGRVTIPRAPAQPPLSAPSGSVPEPQAQILQDIIPDAGLSRQSQSSSRDLGLDPQSLATEPQLNRRLSKQLSGVLQRAGSARDSRKTASAENLLEKSEKTQMTPQHYRCRSSPTEERLNQDSPPGDVRIFGVFISEPGHHSLAEDRSAEVQLSGGLVSPQHSRNTVQSEGPSQDPGSSHTTVTSRERQRTSERLRAHSTSTLAASVGLPCPLSPPGTQNRGSAEWQASERLSQANLDAITFPGIPHPSTGDGDGTNTAGYNETLVTDRQTIHSLSDASILEDTAKDTYGGRAFSLEMRGGCSAENAKPVCLPHFQHASPLNRKDSGSIASSPPPSSHPSIPQQQSSLQISESSLSSSIDQQQPLESSIGLLQDDFDEVFLQNPASLSPPRLIKERSILEDFPPPPPPLLDLEQEAGHQTVESPSMDFLNNPVIPARKSSLHSPPMSPSSSILPSPMSILLPSLKPQPSTITSITTSTTAKDSLGLEYQPLPKREKTSEELRVEALAQQLVLQDRSLVPLLDTWGGKSTVELMEEIFPNIRLVGKSPWQRRGSSRLEERIQDGVLDPAQSTVTNRGKETDLDEDGKDLNTRKVELCEALRRSVAALRQEKEALCEEERCHQALGASIETLVLERLKPNERDKYSMFIGDLEKIVNLLLSLCSRLSRINRSLHTLEREELAQEDAADERDSLYHKRSLLLGQTEDAWELKENLDRRQRVVHAILSGYLTELQLQDYRRFVSTKPSILIRQRHLDDLIRQGEEQLTRLAESLPQEQAEAHGWLRGNLFSSSSLAHCSFPPSAIPGPAHLVRSTTVTSL
ncbi:protein Shroom3 isoform X1 [Perca flavescens]|uniref:protein Shroom3 isoform X1 n=2 Tax=Perca flavescens TaxID=8167 RepID=UPI00106EAED5|nr:protein Shroom3-like isoform X1 [Perca flavescens]XP_028457439.1 protein Shroom3-like isoform X1 [Perca flavescens]